MKIPVSPPNLDTIELPTKELGTKTLKVISKRDDISYPHWDQLRHKSVSTDLSSLTLEQFWLLIKMFRRASYRELPFKNKADKPFNIGMSDSIWQKLHYIDQNSSGNVQANVEINTSIPKTYFINSLIEEAITSSQLEGAATSRRVAKQMLRESRKPKTLDEQMIANNYHAMQFIHEIIESPLTMDNILALHKIITEKTLKNPEHSGALRTTDDILVWDDENHVLHEPPKADTLENRLIILCEFANKKQAHPFVHPIIKAILLHFMLAYDHPFVDGNGRTARALFYWVMAKHNYWLMDYLSISRIIKKSPKQYAYAFLYTETDDNDVTYFIHHQLDVIIKSIKEFQVHLAKKQDEINSIENMLHNNQTLLNKLNHRQISLVSHALRNPTTIYKISAYQNTHNITYDTARTDLLKLAQLKLLNKQKMGNAFTFVVPKNIKQVIIDHKLI